MRKRCKKNGKPYFEFMVADEKGIVRNGIRVILTEKTSSYGLALLNQANISLVRIN